MIEILISGIFLVMLSVILFLVRGYNQVKKSCEKKDKDYSKLLHQKKSSEIILGQVSEKLVPFLDVFTHDPQKASFLGNPIDYIVFDDDEVVFVEVKSGNSRLTAKQRKIKKQVQDKKVRWEEIKIKPN